MLGACVYRVAILIAANEIGKIKRPVIDIIKTLPLNSRLVSTINRAINPLNMPAMPATKNMDIFLFIRRKTKFAPRKIDASKLNITPATMLPDPCPINIGTLLESKTAIATPKKQMSIVIQVLENIGSFNNILENIAAKIGEVARHNNTIATEVSPMANVKHVPLTIWQNNAPRPEKCLKFFTSFRWLLLVKNQIRSMTLPICKPRQTSMLQESISDKRIKRVSGVNASAPKAASAIPNKGLPRIKLTFIFFLIR